MSIDNYFEATSLVCMLQKCHELHVIASGRVLENPGREHVVQSLLQMWRDLTRIPRVQLVLLTSLEALPSNLRKDELNYR